MDRIVVEMDGALWKPCRPGGIEPEGGVIATGVGHGQIGRTREKFVERPGILGRLPGDDHMLEVGQLVPRYGAEGGEQRFTHNQQASPRVI